MSAKILVYDIESTGLDADAGELLEFGYKWIDGPLVGGKCKSCGGRHSKVFTPNILDFNDPCNHCGVVKIDEFELVKRAHEVMSQADICITFNGQMFDAPYMNTKFLIHGLPLLPPTSQIDLYQVLRHKTRMSSKRLQNAISVFGLKHKKTLLDWPTWRRAAKGSIKDIKYIVGHGSADVLATEELYLTKLRPYVRLHPRVNGYGPCRTCGKESLERRGKAATIHKGTQYKFHCTNCNGWEVRPG